MQRENRAIIIKNLQELIESKEYTNISLALEMMTGMGIHAALYTHLLCIIYFVKNYDIRVNAKKLFEEHVTDDFKRAVEEASLILKHFHKNMHEEDFKAIDKLPSNALLEKETICRMALTYLKKGGKYCLENNLLTPKEVLTHYITDGELSIGRFALDTFPEAICDFRHLRVLHLSYNNFKTIPSEIYQLSSLEEIHHQETPLNDGTLRMLEVTFPKIYARKYFMQANSIEPVGRQEQLKRLSLFDRVLSLDQRSVSAYTEKAILLGQLGRFEEAFAVFQQALTVSPQNTVILSHFSSAYHRAGKYQKALQVAEEGLSLLSTQPTKQAAPYAAAVLWAKKGEALLSLECYDQSVAAFQSSLHIYPHYSAASYYLALLFSIKGEQERSLKYLAEAVQINEQFKESALSEKIFRPLWTHKDFQNLVN
ncbi:MAG: tetratricopeptide repeat protein [Thermonemataceae bacterium]